MKKVVPSMTSTPKSDGSKPTSSNACEVTNISDSDNCVDKTTINDFKSVFSENDVTIFSEIHSSQDETCVENTALDSDGSPINSSVESECTELHSASEPSHPYVPFSVEEVSLVKTLDFWSNCNVRVIGTVSPSKTCPIYYNLESVGEEDGPFSILVDIKLLKTVPPVGAVLQIFGELQIFADSDPPNPFILAKFFKDLSAVDIFHYNKALDKLKAFVPHFIDKNKMLRHRSRNIESEPDVTLT